MPPRHRGADLENAVDVEHDQEPAVEPVHAGRHPREPRIEIDRIVLAARSPAASAPRRSRRSAGRRIRPCIRCRPPSAARRPSSAARPSRRRMSIAVTMRPRRLSSPAISGGASGTRVSRSGTNTSCTREIGRPNSWPPIVAVTYSMTFSGASLIVVLYAARSRSAVCSLSAAIRPCRSNLAT